MLTRFQVHRITAILGIGILLLLARAPIKVGAEAQKPSITISPFLREVKFSTADATKDFTINLTNNSDRDLNFNLSVLDFGALDDSGGIVFAGSQASSLVSKYGLSAWLQLSAPNITVKAKHSTDVTATIINDNKLKPGGHYAAVVATLNNPDPALIDQIVINQKLSSLILATKQGGEKYDLKLNSLVFDSSKLHLPDSVTLHFTNPGNVHVTPRGTVKIVSPTGKVVSKGIINEESAYVMPETSRQLVVDLKPVGNAGLWPAFYHIQVDYRYEGIDQFAHRDQLLFFLNAPHILLASLLLIITGWISWKYRASIGKKYRQLLPITRQKLLELKKWTRKIISRIRQSIKARGLLRATKNKKKAKIKQKVKAAKTQKKAFKAAAKASKKASTIKAQEEQKLIKKVDVIQEEKPPVKKTKLEKKPKKLKLKKTKRPAAQPVLLWSRMERTVSARAGSKSQNTKPKSKKTRSGKSPKKS